MRYSGQDDVVVGLPVACRDRPETQGLVGFFVNTLPLRASAGDETSFADLAAKASKAVLEALEHSILPLQEIVAAVGAPRIPGATPLFQARQRHSC